MKRDRAARRQAGYALATTMITAGALLPLGAFALMQVRLDLAVHHHTRAALEAFHVAEAGLAHALADLDADPIFDRLRAGPDGLPDTADDGDFPFRTPPPAFFPRRPFHYTVAVEPIGGDAVEIVAHGYGIARAERIVAVAVRPSAPPFVPAALLSAAPHPTVVLGDGFTVSGSAAGVTPEPPVPALGVPDEPSVDAVRYQLAEISRRQLRGAGGDDSIAPRRIAHAAGLAVAISRLPGAQPLPPRAFGPLGSGIMVARQSQQISDAEGSGVLVVDGDLEIYGRFRFAGLILATGDLHIDRDAAVDISGAVIIGPAADRLQLLGAGGITYSPAAIAAVAPAVRDLLPRRAVVTGWRERL